MVDADRKSHITSLKAYSTNLRKSLASFTEILQHSSFSLMHTNPISYQFKHFQLLKKSSNPQNLSKKSSLSHLSTISTHTRKLSQLTSQTLSISPKKLKPRGETLSTRRTSNLNPFSNTSLIITSHKLSSPLRPYTVPPGSTRKPSEVPQNLSGSHPKRPRNTDPIDFNISPWESAFKSPDT